LQQEWWGILPLCAVSRGSLHCQRDVQDCLPLPAPQELDEWYVSGFLSDFCQAPLSALAAVCGQSQSLWFGALFLFSGSARLE
jgi:hypothetical protein